MSDSTSDSIEVDNGIFFVDYIEDTLDPGWSLIIGCLIACILLNITLPCMVSLGSRYERRKQHNALTRRCSPESSTDDDDDHENAAHKYVAQSVTGIEAEQSILIERMVSETPSSILTRISEEEEEEQTTIDLEIGGSSSNMKSRKKKRKSKSSHDTKKKRRKNLNSQEHIMQTDPKKSMGSQSYSLDLSRTTTPSNDLSGTKNLSKRNIDPPGVYIPDKMKGLPSQPQSSYAAPTCFGDNLVGLFCGMAQTINDAQLVVPRSRASSRGSGTSVAAVSRKGKNKKRTKKEKAAKDSVINTEDDESIQHTPQSTRKYKDIRSDVSRSSSVSKSVLSRLHHDDVSFTEAVDKYNRQTAQPQNSKEDTSGEIDLLCGERAWWKPKILKEGFDKIVEISEIDQEMIALVKTALPFSAHGFFTGLFNLVDVALIGYLVGTKEASVFVVVSMLTWLPTTIAYGFFEAMSKMIPLTLEHENHTLAGTYFNTSITLFTLAMIPIGILWSLITSQTFLWFGFDTETSDLAQTYSFVQVVLEWITGIGYGGHLFLDLIGHERYSTYANLTFGIGQTLGVVLQVLIGQKSLVYIGLCRTMFAALHVLGSSLLVVCWGWLDKYSNGIVVVPLKNQKLVKEIFSTGCPMGLSYFLTYGEWELLVFFVKALGPAEVVTWSMVGYLWSILKYITDGLGDAAESRCAFHLLSNEPELAKQSANKSQFLGLFVSMLVTSVVFIIGMELTQSITPDPTLQRLMVEVLPLIGIANIVQSTGLISASILGAQGRSGMATLVQFLGSWCVTIIFGSIFTYGLQIDLQGLTSAVVLGLALSGAGNTYLFMRSEWDVYATILSEGLEHNLNEELPK